MPPSLVLPVFRIASPCAASWERMEGDERVRFCARCEKSVYNLSAMTMLEAAALIRERDGRLCVRLFRRGDGTVLTADCPVGLKERLKYRVSRAWFAVGALAGTLLTGSTLFGDRFSRLFGGNAETADVAAPCARPKHETGLLIFDANLDRY